MPWPVTVGRAPSLREGALPRSRKQAASGGSFTVGERVWVEPVEELDGIGLVWLGLSEARPASSGGGELLRFSGDAGEDRGCRHGTHNSERVFVGGGVTPVA